MKAALLVLALGVLGSTAVNAQAIRTCTNEVLTCRLEKELPTGGKITVSETSAKFSGLNNDEPSIEPDECTLSLSLENEGLMFSVSVGDSDYVANVYAQKLSNPGSMLQGDAAFPIMTGKRFYFRHTSQIISCVLH
ncbi:MAG: hypothetical protein H7177_01785 [Rhizobacter sp.]|nr:hypothetical protein [Bacteriovorax sp.]